MKENKSDFIKVSSKATLGRWSDWRVRTLLPFTFGNGPIFCTSINVCFNTSIILNNYIWILKVTLAFSKSRNPIHTIQLAFPCFSLFFGSKHPRAAFRRFSRAVCGTKKPQREKNLGHWHCDLPCNSTAINGRRSRWDKISAMVFGWIPDIEGWSSIHFHMINICQCLSLFVHL
jgi:hypothetical protein